ncbi:YodL domain-containing protein [Oscillibacter sp. GMB15532]|uniref:YodL domain-containing protein n=1 Tax=Oscillibacter sp. GMB15532 TaxID=3230022 RepID=UPI0034DEC60E
MAEKGNTQSQVKEIIGRLEAGMQDLFTSEKYMSYLQTLARFPRYSTRNVLLIHMQKPDATLVAGFQTWQSKFGRYVKKGEKGIKILAPTPFTVKKERQKMDPDTHMPILSTDGLPVTEEVELRIPRFKAIPVFDLSQTDGKPLAELQLAEELSGDVRHYELFMEALRAVSPLPISFKAFPPEQDGECEYGVGIRIREGMSEIQTVAAIVHEITHAVLHDGTLQPEPDENEKPKDDRTKEVEAESVAYTVCQYYGIETSPNSLGYIAEWSKSRELKELSASLDVIRKTAVTLIDSIDRRFRELAAERGINLATERSAVAATESLPQKEYGEQTALAALARLTPGELVYLENAVKPVQVVAVRESDVLFMAPELAAELTLPTEKVVRSLLVHGANRPFLEAAEYSQPGPPQTESEKEPEKQYALGYGHMGNGLTVWNRLEEQNGDYVTVAHIDPDRSVTFYDKNMPESVRAGIEKIARTSDMRISATQDAPVFRTAPEPVLPNRDTAPEPQFQKIPDPIPEEEPIPEPEQSGTEPEDVPPDSAIGLSERDLYGYTDPAMLPLLTERALELFDADHTIYMLHPDNTEAMVFEREEITGHDGIFGIEAGEWQASREFERMKQEALDSEGSREGALLYGTGDRYGIYQLKDGDALHFHRFSSLKQLEQDGLSVERNHYKLVYTAPLPADTELEELFELHNRDDRPAAKDMRSLSVSDIVVLRRGEEVTSHYVDSFGFAALTAFLGAETRPQEQPTYSQPGNTPEERSGPSVAELEATVKAGGQISLTDLANAVHREKPLSERKEKPSILARLQEGKRTTQGMDTSKSAPKRDSEREV